MPWCHWWGHTHGHFVVQWLVWGEIIRIPALLDSFWVYSGLSADQRVVELFPRESRLPENFTKGALRSTQHPTPQASPSSRSWYDNLPNDTSLDLVTGQRAKCRKAPDFQPGTSSHCEYTEGDLDEQWIVQVPWGTFQWSYLYIF